jgi:hypothetical protein
MSSDERDGTRIDLGDDLLEKTGSLVSQRRPELSPPPILAAEDAELLEEEEPAPPAPKTEDEIQDHLESARILASEGLLEEAKRILRRIILADPHHVAARKKLEEIHELELKQIFSESYTNRFLRKKKKSLGWIDSEAVMRQLDRDLKLGVFNEGEAGESLALELSLFEDREGLERFGVKLDKDLAGSTARDRLDIGIGFLEMDLHDLAARQFKAAARDPEHALAATGLLAYALILSGRSFEATLTLEPVLGDSEIPREEKLDFIYLMGRAQERLQNRALALEWYGAAREIEPRYRDVEERIRLLSRPANREADR